MHGVIFYELQKYADTKVGPGTWQALLREAGFGRRSYLATQDYPDGDAVALATAASRLTGLEASTILEDFGQFIVPDLVKMYRSFIRPEWRALDLIENTENTIHKAVRLQNPRADPPALECT